MVRLSHQVIALSKPYQNTLFVEALFDYPFSLVRLPWTDYLFFGFRRTTLWACQLRDIVQSAHKSDEDNHGTPTIGELSSGAFDRLGSKPN